MARVLIAWELGGGNGHVGLLTPIVFELVQGGHELTAALRQPRRAADWIGREAKVVAAPFEAAPIDSPIASPSTFAHVLHNVGFDSLSRVSKRCAEWRQLFETYKPDLVLCDHSPTALLAARAAGLPTAIIGTGFCCPADVSPFPNWRPWTDISQDQLERDEATVLSHVNGYLDACEAPPLARLSQLHAQADAVFLTTIPELDPFGARPDGRYLGGWNLETTEVPEWPNYPGRKAFAYLKDSFTLPALLMALHRLEIPTIIFGDGIADQIRQKFDHGPVKFVDRPLRLDLVTAECDMAILNGTHGLSLAMMLAGKPAFHIPINLEQYLVAQGVVKQRAGMIGHHRDAAKMLTSLQEFLGSSDVCERAGDFATKYNRLNGHESLSTVLREISQLI